MMAKTKWGAVRIVVLVVLATGCEEGSQKLCSNDCPAIPFKQLGLPSLLSARVDGSDWTSLPIESSGEYVLCACEEFAVASVCEDAGGGVIAQRWQGTAADSALIYFEGCEGGPSPPPLDVTVTGTVAQSARVWLGGVSEGLLPAGGRFGFDAAQGLYDLGISDDYAENSSRVGMALIRRNIRITKDTDLGVVDLSSEGVALQTVPWSIAGIASDDVVSTETELRTNASLWTVATTVGLSIRTFPPLALDPADVQTFRVTARNGKHVRGYSATALDSGQLLPRLDASTLGDTGYSWGELPTQEFRTMTFRNVSDIGTTNALTVSKSWLDLHVARSIALDWDIPGFSAKWSVELPVQRTVSISNWDSDRSAVSIVAD